MKILVNMKERGALKFGLVSKSKKSQATPKIINGINQSPELQAE